MGDHHHHGAGLAEGRANQRRLVLALSITLGMTAAEVVGGVLSNSLALLSDAGHMLTDSLALGLSLFALLLARRPPTATRTFGFYRVEIMAAFANGMVLILVSAYIVYEAYQRFFQPAEVRSGLMLIVAAIGLAANLAGLAILRGSSKENLNIRSAFWHMLGDAASSVGVIGAAVIISLTGWYAADPIMSIIITVLIVRGAVTLVIESSNILLEAVPKHLDVQRITREIKGIVGVTDAHDVHVWTITSGAYALSAHIMTDDRLLGQCASILDGVNDMLREKFAISHTTLQLECTTCAEGGVCSLVRSEHAS